MTIHWHFEEGSRPADGGVQQGGPSGTTQYRDAENIIQFPSGRIFSPDSRVSERELSLRDIDRYALFALGSMVVSTLISIGCLFYAGKLIFGLFDLG